MIMRSWNWLCRVFGGSNTIIFYIEGEVLGFGEMLQFKTTYLSDDMDYSMEMWDASQIPQFDTCESHFEVGPWLLDVLEILSEKPEVFRKLIKDPTQHPQLEQIIREADCYDFSKVAKQ